MRIGIGHGCHPDVRKAVKEAARQANAGNPKPDLSIAFTGVKLDQKKAWSELTKNLDPARLVGGSSYAEISPAGVLRDSVVVLNLSLDGVPVGLSTVPMAQDSYDTGRRLGAAAGKPRGKNPLGLLFSAVATGYETETLRGITDGLGPMGLFGGMCSGDYDLGLDHPDFWTSWQYAGGRLQTKAATLAVLDLPAGWKVSYGCEHGWDAVAPPARLTRCEGAVVHEIDGMPILDYYRQFLGEGKTSFFKHFIQRYAFAVRPQGSERTRIKLPVVVDMKGGTVSYYPAEDLKDCEVQLIQSSRLGLLEGARTAARRCLEGLDGRKPSLVFMVSCCTRCDILHSRVGRELDVVREVFGAEVPIFGYYSGGEISPLMSRYADALPGGKPFSGSFYHTTTVCLLALAAPGKVRVKAPKAVACRPDHRALGALLAKSEDILDSTEGFLSNLSRKAYKDGEKLKKQNEVIHRYTPHEVWKEVGERAARGVFELEDREFNGAFLFMDVKGFTTFSEDHAAAEVVAALNQLFDPATRIIYEAGGDVDKYIGDCIFAVFKDARAAVESARKILALFGDLKAKGNPFSVRIGINAGRAVRANVGSAARREYTFIGDAVNLTQRLESNATPGRMLVSSDVYEAAKDLLPGAERREVKVKGKKDAVVCWER